MLQRMLIQFLKYVAPQDLAFEIFVNMLSASLTQSTDYLYKQVHVDVKEHWGQNWTFWNTTRRKLWSRNPPALPFGTCHLGKTGAPARQCPQYPQYLFQTGSPEGYYVNGVKNRTNRDTLPLTSSWCKSSTTVTKAVSFPSQVKGWTVLGGEDHSRSLRVESPHPTRAPCPRMEDHCPL